MLDIGQLAFDDAAHAYEWRGARVPSVTQVLGRLVDYSGVPRDVLENARARGIATHRAIQLDIARDLDDDATDPEIMHRVRNWRTFCAGTGFVPHRSELRVYSERYGFAGTLDIDGHIRTHEYILDLKAIAGLSAIVGPQTWAYAQAYRETFGGAARRRGVLYLPGDTYHFHALTDPTDREVFLSELEHLRSAANVE